MVFNQVLSMRVLHFAGLDRYPENVILFSERRARNTFWLSRRVIGSLVFFLVR